jgi:hypothetical protein
MPVKVLIPSGEQKFLLTENDSPNFVQFNITKSVIPGQKHGRQPIFTRGTALIDVNMRRFRRLVAVEIKLKALFPQYGWHDLICPP